MPTSNPGDDTHCTVGIEKLIADLEIRMNGIAKVVAAYRSGPKDEHTLCFIAISEGQLDELAKVVHRLQALLPADNADYSAERSPNSKRLLASH